METTVSYTGMAEAIKPSLFFHKMNYNTVQPSYEITGVKAGINFID